MANMPPALDLSFFRDRAVLKRIAAVTAACAALGAVYALLAPKWYSSAVTVVPAKAQGGGGGLGNLLAANAGVLASGFLESSLGGADVARIAAVLQSVAVTDAIIEKFDLRKRYDQEYQETARQELWRHCTVKTLPKPNLVELRCEDKDPKFVQQMLAYFAEYGNQVFRRVSVSSATEEVRFLEERVAELRQQADDTAARMRDFQEKHRIVDLDTQAKAVVSAMASLHSQRIARQLELDYARTFSTGDEATTQQLRSQLSVMDERLRDLEEPPEASPPAERQGRRGGEARGGLFPAALAVPKLRAELEGLYRDRKVAEATLIFALERLEAAKANEARDISTFLVLDPPTLPTRHSRPRRFATLAALTLLGAALSSAFEWWRAVGGLAAVLAGLGLRQPALGASSEQGVRPVSRP